MTTAREGDELYEELQDAEVLITTPFWPVYVTSEVMDQAPNLKLILTAGVGSDHVDLGEAAEREITVAEQTAANVVSVAEHAAMCILNLVRNFVPQYNQVINGEWDIAGIAKKSYELEGKTVGIYGAGAIGQPVAMRLRAFDVRWPLRPRRALRHEEGRLVGQHGPRRDRRPQRPRRSSGTGPPRRVRR